MSIVRYMNFMNGEESIGVHLDKREDLIEAMRFKAKHIKAHAEPEIFETVANALENSAEVVRCKDCARCRQGRAGMYCSLVDFLLGEDDYCSKGVKKDDG